MADVEYAIESLGKEFHSDNHPASDVNQRISISPRICHGQPCVAGTRVPVHQVVRMLANGDSMDNLLAGFSSLTRDDVMACLDFAATLTEAVALNPHSALLRDWDNPADDVFNELLTK